MSHHPEEDKDNDDGPLLSDEKAISDPSAATTTISSSRPQQQPPPRLVLDDGSRVFRTEPSTARTNQQPMKESSVPPDSSSNNNSLRPTRRDPSEIREYYEVDQLVAEIQQLKEPSKDRSLRIALQFPDEQLAEAPMVTWAFQSALPKALVFVLADAAAQPCCPDTVAAAHLDANVLIHYGHACFSSLPSAADKNDTTTTSSTTSSLTILYSLGRHNVNVQKCAESVLSQMQQEQQVPQQQQQQQQTTVKVLIMYQTAYHHAMPELARLLEEGLSGGSGNGGNHNASDENDTATTGPSAPQIVVGQIPLTAATRQQPCSSATSTTTGEPAERMNPDETPPLSSASVARDDTVRVGGLELPSNVDDWSDYTLLFIGDDTCPQYLNIVLWFLSVQKPPRQYWTWHPAVNQLSTSLSPAFSRCLNRRFYLVQKVRAHASVFGIVVASPSDASIRSVVSALRGLILQHSSDDDPSRRRSVYTFSVGKINTAKLANFGEIDCFVLVACPEHALLQNDRDYHVPVLSPLELVLALGSGKNSVHHKLEWGSIPYSFDRGDFLAAAAAATAPADTAHKFSSDADEGASGGHSDDEQDNDAPYFNLATGQYEAAPSSVVDLTQHAGQGQITEYHSAASDFLKQREYQGLQVVSTMTKEGDSKNDECSRPSVEVHAAVPGRRGIASGYSSLNGRDSDVNPKS